MTTIFTKRAWPDQRQPPFGLQITRGILRLAAFAFGLGVALPTLAQTINGSSLSITGQSTLQGDVVMCSGHPWIDVRCNGAAGDGNHDDTTAVNTTVSTAIANNWPVHFPAGTYKVTSTIAIDYAGQASKGFRLISEGAVIDGRTIASGPVLQIQCGGGTVASPTGCFYFKEEGALFVNGNTSSYAVVLGKADFSDAHNSAKFDHLIVNNGSTAPGGGRMPAQLPPRQRCIRSLRVGWRGRWAGARAGSVFPDFRCRHGTGHRRPGGGAGKRLQFQQHFPSP